MSRRHLFLTSCGLTYDMKNKFFDIIENDLKLRRYFISLLLRLKQRVRGKDLQYVLMSFL